MAKKMKKIFEIIMVVCMLTGMLPVQALAEEASTEYLVATANGIEGSMMLEGNHIVVEFFPAENAFGEESVDWNSNLTLEGGITPEVQDVIVNEEKDTDTTTVTETVIVGTEGSLENGAVVEGEETYTETTTTTETSTTVVTVTENGTRTETTNTTTEQVQGVVEGKETITGETLGTVAGTTVDVSLTPDDPETDAKENVNEVTGAEVGTVLESEGEKPEQLGEGEYEYSETVVQEQGSVTITTTDVQFSEKVDVENTNMDYTVSTTTPTDDNDLCYPSDVDKDGVVGPGSDGVADEMYQPGYEGEVVAPEGSDQDNYGYTYVGAGNTSKFMPSIVYKEPLTAEGKVAQYGENAYIQKNSITYYYVGWLTEEVKATIARDEKGDYVTDENGFILDVNGNRILKEERTSVDPEGNTVYLHRFDNFGAAMYAEGWYENGEWVEEVNGDKSFAAIWAGPQQFILVDDNGNVVTTYCADVTTPTQDNYGYNVENLEDADYYSEEEAKQIRAIASNGYWGDDGNLDEMRQNLLEAGFSEEELASLNDGVALTATQMAIWSCSNKMSSIQFINSYYSNWGTGNVPAGKEDEVKLLFKLYDHLMALDPVEVTNTTADTVITKDNFVDDVDVTVIEKVAGDANNQDDDDTNDVYKTNISFALVVKPSTENGDDLIVEVIDAAGNVIASGRVAGTPVEGEEHQQLVEVNGNYTLEGIVMTEGEQNFKLTLTGIQHLQEGVYLYSSEIRQDGNEDVSSQTLVGKASGDRGVNVEMSISFELNVNDEIVVTERVWRDEYDPETNSTTVHVEETPEESGETPPPPVTYRMSRNVGQLETILDEEVPLAEVPETGDISVVWFALILMSVCGLYFLYLTDKKSKA